MRLLLNDDEIWSYGKPSNTKLKSKGLKNTFEIILGFHFFVAIVKMIVIGIFSGLSDLFSCVILWCGLCRFDYCNMLIYIILTLFDAF